MKDANGDGIIDNYDMVKVGNTVPKMDREVSIPKYLERPYILSQVLIYALGFKVVGLGKPCGSCLAAQGAFIIPHETHDTWSPENSAQHPTYA